MKKSLSLLCVPLLLAGCDMIEYHPYEVDVSYTNLNERAIELIEAKCEGKDTVRFVWMGDTQRWYDQTEAMVRDINRRAVADFVMHGGDISDFGMGREFDWVHNIMRRLDVPYVALIGNHDILGTGYQVFRAMYGPLNFSFVAGCTKFVCLNTNALEFDYSYPVPDFSFLTSEINDTGHRQYEQTVVAMHSNPFGSQFNNNTAYIFQRHLGAMKNLQFCLHAHAHELMVNDYFEDGVLYYGCDCMKGRNYMLFTIAKDHYEYEVIYF